MIYPDFSHSTKKLLLLFLSALFSYWVLLAQATCSASGTQVPNPKPAITYQITEPELHRLDEIFIQLSQNNGKLQNELTDSRTELAKSQEALKKAQQELIKLQLQISELKSLSVNQENSLQKVNESFNRYAAEVKQERLRIKAQRNAWQGAVVVLAVIATLK